MRIMSHHGAKDSETAMAVDLVGIETAEGCCVVKVLMQLFNCVVVI